MECVDGATGQSVWRCPVPHPHHYEMSAGPLAAPHLCSVEGRRVLVSVVGPKVTGVDAESGKPAWQVVDLGNERFLDPPRLASVLWWV